VALSDLIAASAGQGAVEYDNTIMGDACFPKIGEIGEIGFLRGRRFVRDRAKSGKRIELQLFAYEHLTTNM
jgi:hypothetical protein